MAQSENGLMSWQSVAGIVAATFAGCAAVITWLDARAKRMLSEATAELKDRITRLEDRVSSLEADKSESRGHLNKGMLAVAMGRPPEEILGHLEAADLALH